MTLEHNRQLKLNDRLNNVKVIWQAEVRSDHYLFKMEIENRMAETKKSKEKQKQKKKLTDVSCRKKETNNTENL